MQCTTRPLSERFKATARRRRETSRRRRYRNDHLRVARGLCQVEADEAPAALPSHRQDRDSRPISIARIAPCGFFTFFAAFRGKRRTWSAQSLKSIPKIRRRNSEERSLAQAAGAHRAVATLS